MNWLFDQPENCAVITQRQVMLDGAPILYVAHNSDDHGWQFLTGEELKTEDALLVSLVSVVSRDISLRSIADLPLGWEASRKTVDSPWTRLQSAEDIESE